MKNHHSKPLFKYADYVVDREAQRTGVIASVSIWAEAQLENIPFESPIEERMYYSLRNAGIEKELIKAQVAIGRYRVDFLINGKTIVECDGKHFHHGRFQYERKRDNYFFTNGYDVFHFSGSEIKNCGDDKARWLKNILMVREAEQVDAF